MFGGLAFLIGGNMAMPRAAKAGCWFASILRSQTPSSPRQTLTSWRCADARCRGGYVLPPRTFALSTSSPNGSSSAQRTPAHYRRSARRPEHSESVRRGGTLHEQRDPSVRDRRAAGGARGPASPSGRGPLAGRLGGGLESRRPVRVPSGAGPLLARRLRLAYRRS